MHPFLFDSAFSLLRSLGIGLLRGGPTATLAMHTYSSNSLTWRPVITSEAHHLSHFICGMTEKKNAESALFTFRASLCSPLCTINATLKPFTHEQTAINELGLN